MARLPPFKVDENLPQAVVDLLRAEGIDARHVLDQGMGGVGDLELAQACAQERRAILTLDLDFADIRRFPPGDHQGILVLRLSRQDRPHVLEVFQRVLSLLAEHSPQGQLWIIDESGVRVRTQDP